MLNIIIFILATIAFISIGFAIYYHLEFQKACRKGFFVSSYRIDLMDQKKTAATIVATVSLSFALIVAILKQNYIGG